jgi:ABC-type antimicrobial peptide transport system permease subunit
MGGSATRPAPPAFYFSWSADVDRDRSVLVRAAGDPWETLPAIRQVVEGLDPQLPIYQIRTMEDIAEARLDSFHVAMSLFGIFAGFALLLGAVGIYGVMSFSVSQRKRELGVRLALGASRSSVLWMVLRQGAGLTTPGVLLGLGLALASARVLGGLLYDVSPLDVRVYVAVAALLGLVSLVATYLPAYRATRVDPMTGIRSE